MGQSTIDHFAHFERSCPNKYITRKHNFTVEQFFKHFFSNDLFATRGMQDLQTTLSLLEHSLFSTSLPEPPRPLPSVFVSSTTRTAEEGGLCGVGYFFPHEAKMSRSLAVLHFHHEEYKDVFLGCLGIVKAMETAVESPHHPRQFYILSDCPAANQVCQFIVGLGRVPSEYCPPLPLELPFEWFWAHRGLFDHFWKLSKQFEQWYVGDTPCLTMEEKKQVVVFKQKISTPTPEDPLIFNGWFEALRLSMAASHPLFHETLPPS